MFPVAFKFLKSMCITYIKLQFTFFYFYIIVKLDKETQNQQKFVPRNDKVHTQIRN